MLFSRSNHFMMRKEKNINLKIIRLTNIRLPIKIWLFSFFTNLFFKFYFVQELSTVIFEWDQLYLKINCNFAWYKLFLSYILKLTPISLPRQGENTALILLIEILPFLDGNINQYFVRMSTDQKESFRFIYKGV